jgi:hypothetical protein
MKKNYVTLFLISICLLTYAQDVSIPDAAFKAALVADTNINTNADAEIQVTEANAFTGTMSVNNLGISDMTGLEEFTSLINLYCVGNNLTTLDVSANTALIILSLANNSLVNLDVTTNTNLETLACGFNDLVNITMPNNTALKTLNCAWNSDITSLNLSNKTNLENLQCNSNSMEDLDLTNLPLLEYLNCANNNIGSLDLSNSLDLLTIACEGNNLISLNTTLNTDLSYIGCAFNDITSLDIATNTLLTSINCQYNELTELDVTNNTLLTNIRCQNNVITDLDVSDNVVLTTFFCENNSLSTLDIKNANNSNMSDSGFNALNNPGLTCIQVDDETYSTSTWTNIDAAASFNTDCGLSVEEYTLNDVYIFPNPVTDVLTISSLSTTIESIKIFNQLGQLVLENANQESINVSKLSQGIYYCKIKGENGNYGRKRIIKN